MSLAGERTNTDRAKRVFLALAGAGYAEGLGADALRADPTMARQTVKDLLGDVRHFCDRAGVDYGDADQSGYRAYQQERWEDPAGEWPLTDAASPLPPHPLGRCHDDCRHPDLDHAADDAACQDANGQPLTLRPSETAAVECKFCGGRVPAATAHAHEAGYVGDDCCWDERLRSTA